MEELKKNEIKLEIKRSKPPYLLGLLGLIPLVGFFVGIGLILYGILKYKDKKLIMIGTFCVLFTVIVYSSLFYISKKSDFGKKGWTELSQNILNSLIKEVEFYKIENGFYPENINQLEKNNQAVFINDPIQSSQNRKTTLFYYKKINENYLLFSLGFDGKPNTKDDIYPQVLGKKGRIGWIRQE